MNGWVTIGFKGDSSQLEKDLAKSKSQLLKYEQEAEKLATTKAKADVDVQAYEREKQAIQEATDKSLEFAQTTEQVEWVLDAENIQLEQLNEKYSKQLATADAINKKIEENKTNQELLRGEIEKITKEYEKQKNLKDIENIMGNISKETNRTIKQVGRWALSIFGIRTAYSFLSQSMSTLSQYNDELATKLSNIRLVLATALEPVINRILNLVVTLLSYLNYLTKAWFGIDMFARASELSTAKAAKNLGRGAKAAKEINKQLAGFDEMNVLQDSSSAGGGGGGGAGDVPEFNLPEAEIPEWMKWIADHGEVVRKIIEGIAAAVMALKLGLTGLQGLGIFLILDGVLNLIRDIKKYIDDPTWGNFANILRDIGEILVGIALVVGITSPLGIILAILGQLATIIAGIIEWLPSVIEFIKDPSWDKYVATIQNGVKSMGLLGMAINWVIENVLGGWQKVMSTLEPVFNWVKEHIIDPIKTGFEGLFNGLKEIFTPIIDFFKNIFEGVYNNIKISVDNIKLLFSWLWTGIKEIFKPVAQFFKGVFESAFAAIKSAFSPVITFFSQLWEKIKATLKGWGEKIGQVVGGALKNAINSILGTIDNILNTPIKAINSLIDKIRKVPGLGGLQRLNTIKIPRLAKGGIINLPGRGVPVGSAIGGERGQEGVIPLTDSQQMALLGEAIGKYITVNANITNTMNGRVISRELQKVQNENDFAFNR